ncbi:MAG: restriction endonuclease [Acidimicrobiia bacterium]
MAWRDYEEEVARFFSDRGWTVEPGAVVQGVRTKHKLDVWALTDRLGVVTRWVIECKDWNTKVPKEKVLALRTIVEDIGADRGVILNEKGFQSGAYEAATSANVTVSTLAELEQATVTAFNNVRLEAAHRTLADLTVRAFRLMINVKSTPTSGSFTTRRGVRDKSGVMSRLGIVSAAETSTARARAGQLPVPMPTPDFEHFSSADTLEQVLERATAVIEWMEDWLTDQEAGIEEADGWGEENDD